MVQKVNSLGSQQIIKFMQKAEKINSIFVSKINNASRLLEIFKKFENVKKSRKTRPTWSIKLVVLDKKYTKNLEIAPQRRQNIEY